jgi:aldehyde:ferredoxin oxidoreductase
LDDDVKICDASDLWGKDIREVTDTLRDKHGQDISTICIGPAGENLAKMTLAFIDAISTLGRGGLGAIMGAKRLKAIIAGGNTGYGHHGIGISDRKDFQELLEHAMSRALSDRNRDVWIKYGLMGVSEAWYRNGIITYRDNRREVPLGDETVAKYGIDAYKKEIETIPWAGPSCITCDKSILKVRSGEFAGLDSPQSLPPNAPLLFAIPHGLTMAEGVKGMDILNRYGIDVIDTMAIIDVLVDLQKNGVMSAQQMGIDLSKIDFQTLSKIFENIAKREGFWKTVGDGLPAIFEKIPESRRYAIEVKGLVPAFDGRTSLGIDTLGMMTMPRGAQSFSLVRSPSTAVPGLPLMMIRVFAGMYRIPAAAQKRIFREEGKWDAARFLPYVENHNTALNCAGLCFRFYMARIYSSVVAAAFYSAVTGIQLTGEEFDKVGERVWNLQKVLNAREGFDRKDDRFPERWLKEPIKFEGKEKWITDYTGTERITEDKAEAMLSNYYEERGWDVNRGIPTEKKLDSLGLEEVAENPDIKKILT